MRKWKPSKKSINEFKQKITEVETFCKENNISASLSLDSFYFELNGKKYRVSNHTVEASNSAAYKDGVKIREEYHPAGRQKEVAYIYASKTRLIEIYNNIKAGFEVDGHGYVK